MKPKVYIETTINLLTWNYKHLANAALRGKIEATCREMGYEAVIICTPQELMEV